MHSRVAHSKKFQQPSELTDLDDSAAAHANRVVAHLHHRRYHENNHGHGHGYGDQSRAHSGTPSQPPQRASAITDAHAILRRGHRVRIGMVAFWTVVGSLVIIAAWSAATATLMAFQGDARAKMAEHEAQMQALYEARLAEIRARIDRVTSRQTLDQEQLELKLDQIVRRQSVLEQHATSIGTISDSAANRANARNAPSPGAANPRALPMSGSAIFTPPMFREAKLSGNGPGAGRGPKPRSDDAQAIIARVMDSLDRVESRQTKVLTSLEESYEAKARRLHAVLAEAGIEHAKGGEAGVGGPFIPYRVASGGSFETYIRRINAARSQVNHLTTTIASVPLRKPVDGAIDTSSGFGVRSDPFLGRPAMHTGIDFRGETGGTIHVTAAGVVASAGWSGGYGLMVEVDHGNGLSTRYGHMSEIGVKVGQAVKPGQAIGKIGSTGRSTGPHLHYETRIGGEAVDPHRFLHAGEKSGLI